MWRKICPPPLFVILSSPSYCTVRPLSSVHLVSYTVPLALRSTQDLYVFFYHLFWFAWNIHRHVLAVYMTTTYSKAPEKEGLGRIGCGQGTSLLCREMQTFVPLLPPSDHFLLPRILRTRTDLYRAYLLLAHAPRICRSELKGKPWVRHGVVSGE